MSRATQDTTGPRLGSYTELSSSAVELSRSFYSRHNVPRRGPTTPHVHRYTNGLGSSPVARHYWGNHCCLLLLRVLRCFSSPGSPHQSYMVMAVLPTAGLSHSEIAGSTDTCSSPALIAACHVLHRLCEPRHPPSALSCFISPGARQRTDPSRPQKRKRKGRGDARSSYFQLYCNSYSFYGLNTPRTWHGGKAFLVLFYSLACVNMSKIYSRSGNPAVPGTGLAAPILFLTKQWRITDSNR